MATPEETATAPPPVRLPVPEKRERVTVPEASVARLPPASRKVSSTAGARLSSDETKAAGSVEKYIADAGPAAVVGWWERVKNRFGTENTIKHDKN